MPALGLIYRIRVEEAILERSFGQEYRSYKRKTNGSFLTSSDLSGGLTGLHLEELKRFRRGFCAKIDLASGGG